MDWNHGGDWAGFERRYGRLPLDFSASVSPLGLPEGARRAAAAALARADRYPDPFCRDLRGALSRRHGVAAERIVCGNGAAELLYRLALALRPGRALVTAPTFSGYEEALALTGWARERFPLRAEEDFSVSEALLRRITPELDLLFLCEPNNPTGRTTAPALLRRILERCGETGTVLAVDECFNRFLDDPEEHSLTRFLGDCPRLVILRAFTKWYAMAGLRLGYALCGSEELARRLERCGPPWAVSAVAQAAGLAALEATEYDRALGKLIPLQRRRLQAGLTALGCRVVPGEANFLLFRCDEPRLCEKMSARGILLRDCAAFPGLGPGWVRAAVRTAEENDILLRELKEVL